MWLFHARTLILDNRRKLNLKFTKLGLVDCGAMTHVQIGNSASAYDNATLLHNLLLLQEQSDEYQRLLRQTKEYAYLKQLAFLSDLWITTYRSVTQNKDCESRQELVGQLEALQAENTENFPVPREMSWHLAVLLKRQKWMMRYEILTSSKKTVVKQIEALLRDANLLEPDLQIKLALEDLTPKFNKC